MLLDMFYSLGKSTRACLFAHLLPHNHLKLLQFCCLWLFLFIPSMHILPHAFGIKLQHVSIYCADTTITHLI